MAATGAGAVADPKGLRVACRLALAVAALGEQAEARIPAPAALVPLLRHSRLSAAAYSSIARAVDDDEGFRLRVAADEGATESEVGRAGWLWLTRPEGWTNDPAVTGAPGTSVSSRVKADPATAAAARHRRVAERAEADLKRTKEQLVALRQELSSARSEAEDLRRQLAEREQERHQAMRAAKALEADRAEVSRQLNLARAANREAEAELLAVRSRTQPGVPTPAPAPVPAETDLGPAPIDTTEVVAAVAAAGAAADELGRHLSRAAAALEAAAPQPKTGPAPSPAGEVVPKEAGKAGKAGKARKGKAKGKGGGARRVAARQQPSLPPGLFDGSDEANRHLVMSGEALLLVDGYNVARQAWSGLTPEEERRRTVALLEEVQARSAGAIVVVFDGDSGTVAPAASRAVRVQFSATGVTADDEIAAILRGLPGERAVVVVSSDRAVAADARRQGAVAMGASAFVAAAGR